MTIAGPLLPGVVTRSRALAAGPPAAKRSRVADNKSTIHTNNPPVNDEANYEQWLTDVSNVDIALSVSMVSHQETPDSENPHSLVSIPDMLTRVLQKKLAIDPDRLTTMVKGGGSSSMLVALSVKGREGPLEEAIEGGLTPRKAFLRSAPHISRVASRLQDCMRQIFGIDDFVVKVD